MGTAISPIFNRVNVKGNLVGGAGNSLNFDVAIPTDRAVRVTAEIFGSLIVTSHIASTVRLVSEAVFVNTNGTVTLPTALTASGNPKTASNLGASRAEVSDSGAEPTATWTVNGTNGRLTIANAGAGSALDLEVVIDSVIWGTV